MSLRLIATILRLGLVAAGLLFPTTPIVADAVQPTSAATSVALLPPDGAAGALDLVPLSVSAAQHGVIVLVAATEVHITRPDGSEVCLHGVPFERGSVRKGSGGSVVPVIYGGEAWVPLESIPALLGQPLAEVSPHGISVQAPQSFETFEVQKPVVSSPPVVEQKPSRRLPRLDAAQAAPRRSSWLEVSPMTVGLGLNRTLALNGPGVRGFYQESFGAPWHAAETRSRRLDPSSPFSSESSYFSVEMRDGRRAYEIGDAYDPLFGTSTEIGFSSALSQTTSAGAAVLLPSTTADGDADGKLAFRAQTVAAKHLRTEGVVASDGAYYALVQWDRPELSMRASTGETSDGRRRDAWWRLKAAPALSFTGRSSALAAEYDGAASAIGLTWDMGRARAAIERTSVAAAGDSWRSDTVSLSLFRHDLSGLVRYIAPRQDGGRAGLEWTVSRAGRNGWQLSLSSSAPQVGEFGTPRTYRVAGYGEIRRRIRARLTLARESRSIRPEFGLEYRPTDDQVISARYGSYDSDLPGWQSSTAFVIQAALSLGGPGRSMSSDGRIRGYVRDDAGQGVPDVAVVADKRSVALTQGDGSYEFSGLGEGRHTVRLDPGRIPADLSGDARERNAFVTTREPGRADFTLTRLCQIGGRVYAGSASSGQQEPMPDVIVQLNTGARTSTDEQGRYCFGSLSPGNYTVAILTGAATADLSPVPPSSWSFRLGPGQKATGADFGFLKRERPVIFGQLPG